MRFDYVVCVEVIEHIPRESAEGLLAFLNRFVKKNKCFVVRQRGSSHFFASGEADVEWDPWTGSSKGFA